MNISGYKLDYIELRLKQLHMRYSQNISSLSHAHAHARI